MLKRHYYHFWRTHFTAPPLWNSNKNHIIRASTLQQLALLCFWDLFKQSYITSQESCHCYGFKESFPSEVLSCICACRTFKNTVYHTHSNRILTDIYMFMEPHGTCRHGPSRPREIYVCVMHTRVSVLSLITLCSHSVKSLSLCQDKILIMQVTKLKWLT